MLVKDIHNMDAVSNFRFCREHLQEIADKLWDRGRNDVLGGDKQRVGVENRYATHYKTGFGVLLYCLAAPC